MSVEQQRQQQQLTAIELTKNSNNNNSNSTNNGSNNNTASTSSNNNNSNNSNSSLNLKTSSALDASDHLKHNDILLKAKEPQSITTDCVVQQPKQNGQHYGFDAKETNGGDHIKCQQRDTNEKETQQKIRPVLKDCDNDGHDVGEAEEEINDEEEAEGCNINTACIIKTPLNKTLLKKCTPNGNGNHSPLALTTTTNTSSAIATGSSPCTCNNSVQDSYGDGENDYQDCEEDSFDHFTKIPMPTTQQTSAPSTATTTSAAIKCTKCNNNNNIHYNNYNCYYRKKATRLKPSICR